MNRRSDTIRPAFAINQSLEALYSFRGKNCPPVSLRGDYDGDGLTNPAIYRETTRKWLITLSASDYPILAETFSSQSLRPIRKAPLTAESYCN